MEDRDIPLEVAFANYDEDYTEKTGSIMSPVKAVNDVDGSETIELKKSIVEEQ